MNRFLRSPVSLRLLGSYLLLALSITACGGNATPGADDTVRQAAQTFVDEVNASAPAAPGLSSFFAPNSASFDPANTLDKALQVENALPAGTTLELLRLDILRTSVDRAETQAVVDYDAQLTVTLPGANPVTLDITQDVSLELVGGRWLIIGGDAPVVNGPPLPIGLG